MSPKGMSKPKVDIVLAIHHVKKDLPNVQAYRHVYTHHYTRKAKAPVETKPKRIILTID